MNTSTRMKRFAAIAGSALMGLMFATSANANPENVVVEVTFVAAITISEQGSLKFGLLDVAMANAEEVIIAPNDNLTDDDSNVISGTQEAADLTITATVGAPINILIDNVLPASPDNYDLGTWMCEYDALSAQACDSGGWDVASATAPGLLRVGVTLTGNGAGLTGVDNSTFDVTVTYQ